MDIMSLLLAKNLGGGSATSLSKQQINALDALFKAASYVKDVSAEYAAFCDAFGLANPDEPNPQWIIGLSYGDGGYLGTSTGVRAVYVSETGDHELEYVSTPTTDKKYYPLELGDSNSVVVTCPANMNPAVAALTLSDGKWNEVGISGWMQGGGGKYSIPRGATHYFCTIKKTDNSAFVQADFESVVVKTTLS